MPKLKTNRSAAKRVKKSARGKLLRAKAFGSHLLTKKSRKRKRKLRLTASIHPANQKKMNRLVPYL